MAGRRTSVYLRPELETELTARGDLSFVISRDLDRLYTLYRRALAEIKLTADEACLIVDALNGIIIDANMARLVWANVEDAIRLDGLDAKWNVDGPALVDKLRAMNDIQALAVADATERFWKECPPGDIQEEVKRFFGIRKSPS